ncbi:aromatic acid exporter family protein [Virgibacillus siamensis]|uniref:aromatic acid exporter family protein n=1 Tax=Virgibacillus siamensis TaxID=480071 RepID=UPI000985A4E7|nr:aromatic acid exporter family protein [Virgibacillus siamensis]
MKNFKIAGSRIVKTGLSVFLTAWICVLLDWPPVFAVITAIVTIEPTVSDSIKKGVIRFPASAIGSAYAVFFISLFGNSPLTYTLAAVLTIATCYKLKLYSGLLVATLTAVAMVEVIHSNFLISFFIRLGTTTTGLVVSTVVNMIILPPDYTREITGGLQKVSGQTGIVVKKIYHHLLEKNNEVDITIENAINRLDTTIHKTGTLVRFQKEEAKYHPLAGSDKRKFEHAERQLVRLRLIHYHLNNVMQLPTENINWSEEERLIIFEATDELAEALIHKGSYNSNIHAEYLKKITHIFWKRNNTIPEDTTNFPPEYVILYELVSIYNLAANEYKKDRDI